MLRFLETTFLKNVRYGFEADAWAPSLTSCLTESVPVSQYHVVRVGDARLRISPKPGAHWSRLLLRM